MFQCQFTPNEVVQWSNHRVMEWLRSVDLAEYAPNLRGSGVHGGLIVSIFIMHQKMHQKILKVYQITKSKHLHYVFFNRFWNLGLTPTPWPCC